MYNTFYLPGALCMMWTLPVIVLLVSTGAVTWLPL